MLRAARPKTKVRIINNYLEAEEDRRSMVEGVRMAMEISRQAPFQELSQRPHLVPASDSEADILDFLRKTALTVWHPVGTCAMGSVVDEQLRVNGVDALRVVDASVMPVIPRGNTNAATIMIGEKGADLIRDRTRADAAAALG
jgi:choline dehydrogenase